MSHADRGRNLARSHIVAESTGYTGGLLPFAVVPGSRLVALPGRDHILQPDDPAVAMFVEEVERFLVE
ncbi:hypothetical protein [Agromyces bauzanensis]|uniref:Alpha/beta hydrolase n=1 Tax=Agromyces bauzanensis TaxID=1308924 RepID=A0A917UTU5_9MICO|nr:hypothetical protein [Agromyces bauzanensis]GGJ84678.1 hypothetical protein GCM10011372_23720 [Agromyces bauzanensis]